jgi:D-3-phosphoglycerate dehydrogenase
VDTQALIAALDAGRIAGAALDVFDVEPADPTVRAALAQHPKVILSPTPPGTPRSRSSRSR